MSKQKQIKEPQIIKGKVFAILSYLSIFCIIPLVFFSVKNGFIAEGSKEHNFVFKHAKQGLVIFVCEVAVFIIHIILGQWILRLGMFILGVLSFVGIVAVLKGQHIKLPIVSDIADTISL